MSEPEPIDKDKEIADLKAKLEELEKAKPEPPKPDPSPEPKPEPKIDDDLLEKARKLREQNDKSSNNTKALEAALKFNMNADAWLKENKSILPSDVAEIFDVANKETYDSAIQKDAAIKSGIIQSFFKVQENLDLLTPALKNHLEDYLKLTKTGKEEKAQSMYDSIFEPAFEMLKRVKKAEALGKGFRSDSNVESAYKERLMKLSNNHYIGEKK